MPLGLRLRPVHGRRDRRGRRHHHRVDAVGCAQHADAVAVPVDEMLLGVTPGEFALATGPVPLRDVECFVEILRDLTDDRRAHGREPRDGSLHRIAGRSRGGPALFAERPADAERRHLDVVDRTEGDGRAPGVAVVGSRDDRENVGEGPDARADRADHRAPVAALADAREVTGRRHESGRRLEGRHAAPHGRAADAPPRVASERQGTTAACDRGRRAAAQAAGRTGRIAWVQDRPEDAVSSNTVVLASTIAPATRVRATTVASASGIRSRHSSYPPVHGNPATSIQSLTVIGRPCSGPTGPSRSATAIEHVGARHRVFVVPGRHTVGDLVHRGSQRERRLDGLADGLWLGHSAIMPRCRARTRLQSRTRPIARRERFCSSIAVPSMSLNGIGARRPSW